MAIIGVLVEYVQIVKHQPSTKKITMKLLQNSSVKMNMLFLLMFSAFGTFAQEQTGGATSGSTSSTVTTRTTTSEMWYAQPWVWVVGGAVLLLLLIALLRDGSGKGSADRVTITKTVDRESI